MTPDLFLFWVLAIISVVAAIGMIVQDNPVRSALSLVIVLASVALLFFSLHAVFIGAVQIIVYAGAIMVLFIFVIMLLNLGSGDVIPDRSKAMTITAPILGAVLAATLLGIVGLVPSSQGPKSLPDTMIGPSEIGHQLFRLVWLFPFEVVSILLLIAAVGAVMLAKKRIE